MKSHDKELRRLLLRELEDAGAAGVVFSITGSGHQCLDFVIDGEKKRFVFAASGRSFGRAQQNRISELRRVIRGVRTQSNLSK